MGRPSGVQRQEQDLRVLGPQEPPRGFEQPADRLSEVGRALRRPHRLVQKLDVLALLALRHVAAEGEAAREHGRDEQQAADGIAVDEHDACEPEAGRRGCADERDRERLWQLGCREPLLGDRDHR